MRSFRMGVLFCVFLLAATGWSQQAVSSQPSLPPSPAPQDPQAVSLLNQALAAAGGAAAIKAITDYTATGTVTYHWNPEELGPVKIQGLGLVDIRIDASLPSGTHSESIHDGQTSRKSPDGRLWQYPPPYPIPSSDVFVYQPPIFPSGLTLPVLQIPFVISNPRFSISTKGLVSVTGQALQDIQVQMTLPRATQSDSMAEYRTTDFFIDPMTGFVVMTQDKVPNHIIHQVRYAEYRAVSGVFVPFSISEDVGGQRTRDIQLDQISFNTGLQDVAFDVQ